MLPVTPAPAALTRAGLLWGLTGVVAFSFTVIATRVAVTGMDPLLVGAGRAVIAAALAAACLASLRQPLPRGRQDVVGHEASSQAPGSRSPADGSGGDSPWSREVSCSASPC